ncbi:MAG: hypothetical protein KAV83_09540 [Desulfobacterales bacterium]|nr:hypothetical protein [Desulfobacterales bacterium]
MKQASITFKTAPEIKQALEVLSKQGFRSLSAQVEMIVVKYLEEQGIDWRGDGEKKVNKQPHLGSGNEQE